MTCSGCGMRSCDGRCFLECENDFAAEPETIEVRKPYIPSAEYLAFCEAADQRARAFGLPTVGEITAPHPLKRKAA